MVGKVVVKLYFTAIFNHFLQNPRYVTSIVHSAMSAPFEFHSKIGYHFLKRAFCNFVEIPVQFSQINPLSRKLGYRYRTKSALRWEETTHVPGTKKNTKEGELSVSLELTISRNVVHQKTSKKKTEKITYPSVTTPNLYFVPSSCLLSHCSNLERTSGKESALSTNSLEMTNK